MSSDPGPGRRPARLLLFALALSLSACINPVPRDGNYAEPIGGSAVSANTTPYSEALRCLRGGINENVALQPTVTVGRLLD